MTSACFLLLLGSLCFGDFVKGVVYLISLKVTVVFAADEQVNLLYFEACVLKPLPFSGQMNATFFFLASGIRLFIRQCRERKIDETLVGKYVDREHVNLVRENLTETPYRL